MLFFFLLCPELLELQAGGLFSSILWCSHSDNHPPKELVKFGYRPERKVERLRNPAVFWWPLGTYCLNMKALERKKNPQKTGLL
jgi:hypothetical protein